MDIDIRQLWYLGEKEAKAAREYFKNLDGWTIYQLFRDLSKQDMHTIHRFFWEKDYGEHVNFNMTFVEELERRTGIRRRVRKITGCKSWRVYCIYYNKARPVYPPKYLHDLAHWCVATPEQIKQWYKSQQIPNSKVCKLDSIPITCEGFDEELTIAWETAIAAKYKLTGLIRDGKTSVRHTSESANARLAELGINIDNGIYLAK
jgi:hypothetical protein